MLNYVAVLMLAVVLIAAANAHSQIMRTTSTTPQGHPISVVMTGSDPQQKVEREQVAGRIAERQTQLRLDTEKLVALSAELKRQVDKTGVNILSMDVVKKAQEIQKLAKSVQDKMKNAY
jgi:hypothetical protein